MEKDGFRIDKKVDIVLSGDTPTSISKSTGLGLIGCSDAFNKLNPDLLIVMGDRFEMLLGPIAAMFYNLPIIHFYGGAVTEGAIDELTRHAITKMSHYHFVLLNEYKKRFISDHARFINSEFKQYYAIAKNGSFTSENDFLRFCDLIDIPIKQVELKPLFNHNELKNVYLTEEKSFDPVMISEFYRDKINNNNRIGKSYPSVAQAFKSAIKQSNLDDIIYVGGSTFVVSEVI